MKNNTRSLDGLPGLKSARRERGEWVLLGDSAAAARRIARQREALLVGVLLGFLMAGMVALVERGGLLP